MSLTKIDCYFYRGFGAVSGNSSYVALNPWNKPGSMVVGCSVAIRDSLGSQVACKMALENFTTTVLDFYEKRVKQDGSEDPADVTLDILQRGFERANTSVYDFGHKLAAGGKLTASLLGLVIEREFVAAGLVGPGSAYLYRAGELSAFFEKKSNPGSYVGSQVEIAVELASIEVLEGDQIILFSRELTNAQEHQARETLRMMGKGGDPCARLVKELFEDQAQLGFAMIAKVGPQAIYLEEAI